MRRGAHRRRSRPTADIPLRGQEKFLEHLPIRERDDIGPVAEALYVVLSVHVAAVVQDRNALLQACRHIKVIPSPEDLIRGNMGMRSVAGRERENGRLCARAEGP